MRPHEKLYKTHRAKWGEELFRSSERHLAHFFCHVDGRTVRTYPWNPVLENFPFMVIELDRSTMMNYQI